MEEEIRKTIYELIVDILKTYVFPTEKTLYEELLNEFREFLKIKVIN